MTGTILYRGPGNLVTTPKGAAERVMARLVRSGGRWNDTVARGGRVTVTTQQVMFRPHVLNFCRDTVRIPISDVTTGHSKQEHRAMRLVVLQLAGHREAAFVSWQRDQLIEAINQAHTAPQP